MGSWDDFKDEKSSGGNYLRLKDGEEAEVLFKTDTMYGYWQNYNAATKVYTQYDKKIPDTSRKFEMAVVHKEGDDFIPKFFTFGPGVKKSISQCFEEYGENNVFKIKREGSLQDTKWHILFKKELSADKVKKIFDSIEFPEFSTEILQVEGE